VTGASTSVAGAIWEYKGMLNQSTWRKAGAATIALAALMAVYAALGDVLRDSVTHMARLVSEEAMGDATTSRPLLFCVLYWSVFALLILSSFYFAALDIRFVRLQYVLEKKALIQESLSDAVARPDRGEADTKN